MAEVIELRPGVQLIEHQKARFCHPHQFVLNEQERRVSCVSCSRVFDPFDAFVEVSRDWTRYAANLEQLTKELVKRVK